MVLAISRQHAEGSLLISTPIHSLKNPRILVVDDNLAIHEDFRKILGIEAEEADFNAVEEAFFGTSNTESPASGFILEFASQGREALGLVTTAMLAELPYAMVFMDVRMPPGWDGIETTARLWEVDPNLQVVICTAYSDHSWEKIRGRLGGSDRLLILKKPFDVSEVIQLAHTLTTRWSLQQESHRHADSLELELEMTERKLSKAALKFT